MGALSSSQDRFSSIYLTQSSHEVQEQSARRRALLLVVKEHTPDWFRNAARKWKAETAGFSSITAKMNHPAYKQIVGLGPVAIPLILKDLEKDTAHWFPALRDIAEEDPVPVQYRGRIEEMKEAWLEWGRQKGYI